MKVLQCIGGYVLIELSGDSIRSLKWTILDQILQYGVFKHVSFQITQVAYDGVFGLGFPIPSLPVLTI